MPNFKGVYKTVELNGKARPPMSDQQFGFDWQGEPGTPGDAPQPPLAVKLANRLGNLARRDDPTRQLQPG